MTPLETWLAAEAGVFSLEAARIAGLLLAAPLGWNHLPARIRGIFALMLTLIVHNPNHAAQLGSASVLLLGASMFSEFSIGVALGFVARLMLGTAELAGDAIVPVMGLSAAQLFDPSSGSQSTVLTRLIRMFALLIALMVGVHRTMLAALFQSFRALPVGTLINPALVAPDILQLTSEMLAAGMKLALPILAILFITQVGLAFVARAAPAMQIFSVGFPVTLGIGGLCWVLFAPDFIRELAQLGSTTEAGLTRILNTLAQGVP